MEDGFELGDALIRLRNDLDRVAKSRPTDSVIGFEIKDVTLEFSIATDKSDKAHGAVKWYVLSAGAEVANSDITTQKVTLKLGVVDPVSGASNPISRTG